MSMINLDGFAIVVGAGSGIGLETAYAFAEAGVDGVLFADVNDTKAAEAAGNSKQYAKNKDYRAISMLVDVSDEQSVRAMVDEATREFGRIDYCVNSAGVAPVAFKKIWDIDMDDFDRLQRVNARGTFILNRVVGHAMVSQDERIKHHRKGPKSIGRGAIVNVASVAGLLGMAGHGPYASSKHAVLGITKVAALELAPQGVRVNAVCPWWTETGMVDPSESDVLDAACRQNPLGRVAQPEDMASVILFLCSPGAGFVNGNTVQVDAGVMSETALYYWKSNSRVDFYQ